MRRFTLVVAGIAFVAFLWLLHPLHTLAATITVTSNGDTIAIDGLATLREAITSINNHADVNGDVTLNRVGGYGTADTIHFTIPGTGGKTILVSGSALPGLIRSMTLDGTTQPGYPTTSNIVVDGNNNGSVFIVNGGVTAVLNGLMIQHGSGVNNCGGPNCGGGIYNGGTLTVMNCTITNNTITGGDGAGIVNNGGTLTVTGSTFSGNSADDGGGIKINNGTVTITNSTFSGNSAGEGGGLDNNGGTVTVTNSTFSGNSGSFGSINTFNDGTATLTNTIVANSLTAGDLNEELPGQIAGDHNLIDDTTFSQLTGSNNVNQPALLGTLGTYGSTNGTQTFPLLPGSLAIDAGDDTTCNMTTGTAPVNKLDQRGITRPVGAHCDIGAFESQGFALAINTGNNQSTPDATAFPTALGVTVSSSHSEPVDGGQVTFTANAGGSGQSATLTGSPATLASGATSVTAQANSAVGSYTVTASMAGATSVTFDLANTLGPAATLTPSPNTPQSATVSTTFPTLSVTVQDAGGNPVADGTPVAFTVTPAGNGASVTFSNGGGATTTGGVATITATANTIAGGPSTVTATSNGHTATFSLTNLPGAPATLSVSGYPSPVVESIPNPFTVTALDQYGNVATGYTGTVHFTSTDTQATLPADYPFVAGDAGVHHFSASFGTAGTQSLTATDTATSALTGTQTGIAVVTVPTTTTLAVAPSPAVHGASVALTATVAAIAPAGAAGISPARPVAPGGSITFADGSTTLATVPLVGGAATFSTNSLTAGLHHLSATYNPSVPSPYATSEGTADETITAAPLVTIAVAPSPVTLKVGQTQQFTATGTYGDGSMADLTTQVTWSSDASGVVGVDGTGNGTAKGAGSAHVTATQGTVSGQATVTVGTPVLTGVQPGPAPANRPSGATTSQPGSGSPPNPAPAPTGR